MAFNLPNALTMSRIAAIPLVVATFYFEGYMWHWIAWVIYTIACITDYFDGYLARSWGQMSNFGRFLDPIADKLLVASVLLMLAASGRMGMLTLIPACIILCREILVSGLREFLAEVRVSVPVSRLAKWKTGIQMVTLGFLLVGDAGPDILYPRLIGEIGLWIAAILTVITGLDYMWAGMRHMNNESSQ